jgi:hypothetical protein
MDYLGDLVKELDQWSAELEVKSRRYLKSPPSESSAR